MAETGEKPTDRIIIDVYENSFELAHTPGLDVFEVAMMLFLCLEYLNKEYGDLQEAPVMLQ